MCFLFFKNWDLVQKGKMDSHGDMGLLGEHYETSSLVARVKEDGYESRSGSDNVEGASGDDQDAAQYEPPRKKYARHSAHQIQELEAYDFYPFV